MNKLSIIIPALNEAQIIGDRLRDLQFLREQGAELVLVDGGSSDETVMLAGGLADLVVHSDRGRAIQMSAGAEAASGDVLWFVHLDTVIPEITAMKTLQQISRVKAGWGFHAVRMSAHRGLLRLVARMMNLRSRLTSVATGDQAMFVSRDLYTRVGGFGDEPLMEDVSISKKLRALEKPLFVRDQVIISARKWESEGAWKTVLLMWRLRLLYFLGVSPVRLAKQYYRK